MMLKRILAIIALAAMLIGCLTSCGDSTPPVLTLGEKEVTEAMYSYWASRFKGNYMSSYEDVENTDAFWNSEISEGMTVAEYLDGSTLDAVKTYLVCSALFDEYRLSFEDKELESIDNYISDLIKEWADGSKNVMNSILSEYGINTRILRKVYIEEEKVSKVFNHLYGEGGEKALTAADYEQFYLDNYVHVQMIYIENISKYKTDENGKRLTDENGYYQIEPLTGEKKEEKDAAVKAVQDGIENGVDFNELYEKYSELKDYKNGHYYSTMADYGGESFYYSLAVKVSGLEVGETATLESEMGTCIVKKLEMDEGAWKNEENKAFFSDFEDVARQDTFLKMLESYYDDIVIDEEILKKYSVKNVPPATLF
ncbi:MAG: hypothetical protein IJD22_01635 [Clostridia bacterium]|nr:hypothetical protein [Clostridia bacterium]